MFEVRARAARGWVVMWAGMERSQFWWVKLVSEWPLEMKSEAVMVDRDLVLCERRGIRVLCVEDRRT